MSRANLQEKEGKLAMSVAVAVLSLIAISLVGTLEEARAQNSSMSNRAAQITAQRRKQMIARSRMQQKRKAAALMSPGAMKEEEEEMPQAAPRLVRSRVSDQSREAARQLLKTGARHHRDGNDDEAERCFRDAVASDPRNADGFFNLGALCEGRGDFIGALGHYRAGLTITPNDQALMEAVESIEGKLAASDGKLSRVAADRGNSFRHPPYMFQSSNTNRLPERQVNFSEPPLVNVQSPDTPILSTYGEDPPVMPVDSGPFQLHSTQNDITGGYSAMAPRNGMVLQSPQQMPVVGVQQPSRGRGRSGAVFNSVLNFGLSAALRGSGLHCPACHFLRF